jgi:two-component system response regulator HupR/HoxA
MNRQPTVLIVDDEARGLDALARILNESFDVTTAGSVAEAETVLQQEWVQIILCGQIEFLMRVREQWPDVIRMVVDDGGVNVVNEAGIYHYITQPWHPESLILVLKNAARMFQLQRENDLLNIELKVAPQRRIHKRPRQHALDSDGLVRSDRSPLNDICERIKNIAAYDISVLIHGESGTGKELAARALHYNSPRWDKPFVVENCGALPDELLESELFGYKKGAFTGAVEDRIGLFERANGGTVFLDEIGEVSPAFQVKLLRVLQEGEVRPLGCSGARKVDLRVIAATNKNLEEEVRAGRFREDLYYRIATMTITMPPLRERRADIPVLAQALLDKAVTGLGKAAHGFTSEALACMQQYHWPGNVRELQNEIQQMLVMGREMLLGAELLSPRVLRAAPMGDECELDLLSGLEGSLKDRVELLEARILRETLIRHRWNKSRAAKELGLSRVGLRSKLERYGLELKGDAFAVN